MNTIEIAFGIISKAGAAKSNYMESINYTKLKEYDRALALIEEGDELRIAAHEQHFELVQVEANGKNVELSLILIHAEDQLTGAEMLRTLSIELLENYKLLHSLMK